MKRAIRLILLVGTMLGAAASMVDAREAVLHYEPAVEVLTGVVKFERHYGPPNFGETPQTDSVLTVPVLVLDTPVTVEGSANPSHLDTTTYPHVTRIQLVFTRPGLEVATLNGRRISVSGTLFEKIVGGQYTDVLMMVQNVGAPAR